MSVLKENASEAEAAAQLETPRQTVKVEGFERCKPARRPLPEHLRRERIVYPSPAACPCCGGVLHKLGEDVTETLELIPRQWKVIQHVREKFSCRSCEAITQPPAPSHPIARGRAGPGLLAHILFSKYGLHLPLNRQSTVYAREGIDLDVSTLADWVGAAAATLMPLVLLIREHVFAAERIHALFAIEREINGKTPQERLHVRNERSRPLLVALETWLREQRAKLSGQSKVGKAIAYSLTRWVALTRFLDDSRLCMSN